MIIENNLSGIKNNISSNKDNNILSDDKENSISLKNKSIISLENFEGIVSSEENKAYTINKNNNLIQLFEELKIEDDNYKKKMVI